MAGFWFSESFFINNGLMTLLFLGLLIVGRLIAIRVIRNGNRPWTSEQRLRAIGIVRSIFFGSLVLGVLFIWGEQLHSFIVSIFAIAFALVFSVKELFMSINGSVTRFRGNIYNLGDRIQIDEYRGDVIDINMLSTTILETGPTPSGHHYTGRVVTFTNSMIMNKFILNESFIDHFYFHNIKIPMRLEEDWREAKEALLRIAKEECSPYLEQARRRMNETARQHSIQLPSVEPRVNVQVPEPGIINLVLRVPSPAHLKGRLEQTILSRFLDRIIETQKEDDSQAKIEN